MEYPVGDLLLGVGRRLGHPLAQRLARPRAAVRPPPATLYGAAADRRARSRLLRRGQRRRAGRCRRSLAAWFLAGVHRRRPWDARSSRSRRPWRSPALVNWDLLAVACVAGALWAWSRDRPVLDRRADRPRHGHQALPAVPARRPAGDLRCAGAGCAALGLATAAAAAAPGCSRTLPAYAHRAGAVEGLLDLQRRPRRRPRLDLAGDRPGGGATVAAHTINAVSWLFFGAGASASLVLGLLAPATPRLAQLAS